MRMAGEGEERAVASKLNLVDLAGSERTKKTGVTGQALKVSLAPVTSFPCSQLMKVADEISSFLH